MTAVKISKETKRVPEKWKGMIVDFEQDGEHYCVPISDLTEHQAKELLYREMTASLNVMDSLHLALDHYNKIGYMTNRYE